MKELSTKERKLHRQSVLKPVMDEYWIFLNSFEPDKDSNLGKVRTHSLNQRKAFSWMDD